MTETVEGAYHLKLSGPGVTIDKSIDQSSALTIVQIVLGGTLLAGQSQPDVPQPSPSSVRTPPMSLREYVEGAAARTNPERLAAFGGYLRDHGDQPDFARDEIKACFKNAGEPLPANFPRDFNNTLQEGWLAEDHKNPGRYYVTRKGDEALKRKFGNDPKTK
jgi:hypothetical protein